MNVFAKWHALSFYNFFTWMVSMESACGRVSGVCDDWYMGHGVVYDSGVGDTKGTWG